MKIKIRIVYLIKISTVSIIAILTFGNAQTKEFIPFIIEDQYKREYTEDAWQDSILILFGSDSKGSKYSSIWSKTIYDSLQSVSPDYPVKRVGLADLRGVPFLLKGFIRGQFNDNSKKIILMDWDGEFAKTYSFVENESNILIFGINRHLAYQTSVKEIENIKLREMLSILEKLVNINNHL